MQQRFHPVGQAAEAPEDPLFGHGHELRPLFEDLQDVRHVPETQVLNLQTLYKPSSGFFCGDYEVRVLPHLLGITAQRRTIRDYI